jgi:hypothetical protein
LSLTLAGCTRYGTRAPGPFGKQPPAAAPNAFAAGPTAPRSPLAIAGAGDPLPPAPPGEAPLVPPRPPAAGVPAAAANPVVPVGGALPFAPGPDAPIGGANASIVPVKAVLKLATLAWSRIDTYDVLMTRREAIGGKMNPQEEVLMTFRKQPFSVYLRNIGDAGKGREVLYVQGAYKDEMQIRTGAGDGIPGLRVSKSPDDPQVRAKSRHSIREAGFGNSIDRLAKAVELVEAGKLPPDAVRHGGVVKRPEHGDRSLELIVRTVAPGDEGLEAGGTWQQFYDASQSPSYGLPVLAILTDTRGGEVEYVCYTRFQSPSANPDFTPDRLGRKR